MKRLLLLSLCALTMSILTISAEEKAAPPIFLKSGERAIFLGDSITQDGRYICYLDLLLRSRCPDLKVELINLGLASETASGLSEPEHPWPRPCVRERIDRALEKSKPNIVFICYGMNDGIYAPFDEGRFQTYQTAIREHIAKGRAAGARVVVLTPPPFDRPSFKNQAALQPEGAPNYGFMHPYADYDQVIKKYGEWIMQEAGLADLAINVHAPASQFLSAWRQQDPKFTQGDGVHPSAIQHWIMAAALAKALGIPADAGSTTVDVQPDANGEINLALTCKCPLPRDPDCPPGTWDAAGLPQAINLLQLKLPQPPQPILMLEADGKLLGAFKKDALTQGLDLTALTGFLPNVSAQTALGIALQRHQILTASWRDHVGHQRPGTPKNGLPLEEAMAQAATLEQKLSELLAPRTVPLKLRKPASAQ